MHVQKGSNPNVEKENKSSTRQTTASSAVFFLLISQEEAEAEVVSYLLEGYKQLVIIWHASLLVICS